MDLTALPEHNASFPAKTESLRTYLKAALIYDNTNNQVVGESKDAQQIYDKVASWLLDDADGYDLLYELTYVAKKPMLRIDYWHPGLWAAHDRVERQRSVDAALAWIPENHQGTNANKLRFINEVLGYADRLSSEEDRIKVYLGLSRWLTDEADRGQSLKGDIERSSRFEGWGTKEQKQIEKQAKHDLNRAYEAVVQVRAQRAAEIAAAASKSTFIFVI